MSFFILNKPIFRKYINFLSAYLSLILIKLGIKTRILFLPILGYILYLITNSNQNLFKFIFNKNKPYLILLEKKGFNEDTIIIRKTFKNLECIGISRKFIKSIASLHFIRIFAFFNKKLKLMSFRTFKKDCKCTHCQKKSEQIKSSSAFWNSMMKS